MESYRLLRIGRSGFKVSFRKLKTRSAEIRDRRARIELDGLAVLTDGGGSLSLVAKGVPHPQPCFPGAGIEEGGSREILGCQISRLFEWTELPLPLPVLCLVEIGEPAKAPDRSQTRAV